MPRLSTSTMARFCFYPVWKASKICCQTVRFRCGTTHCVLHQQASLRYQEGCNACFTEKQRDLSIPYVGRTSQRLHDGIKQHVPKSIRSCSSSQKHLAYFLPVDANLSPRPIPSLLLLIQSLDFTFYKILSVLNIMMTVDSLFLPKGALLSIYLLLKPLLSKLLTPPFADKKNSCAA